MIVALEIVWVRMMGQVGQYHAYLFPTVLGIFLLADGAGMALASRMLRRIEDPRPAFFITQSAGFVLATVLLLALWYALPHWPLVEWLSVDHNRMRGGPLLVAIGLTVLVVAPPSFLIGMTFPFVQRAVQRDLSSVGARVGWVQLANIAGNAAGSILTGLVTFHLLGTAGTLKLLAVLSLLLVGFWLWRAGVGKRPVEAGLAVACGVLFFAAARQCRLLDAPARRTLRPGRRLGRGPLGHRLFPRRDGGRWPRRWPLLHPGLQPGAHPLPADPPVPGRGRAR